MKRVLIVAARSVAVLAIAALALTAAAGVEPAAAQPDPWDEFNSARRGVVAPQQWIAEHRERLDAVTLPQRSSVRTDSIDTLWDGVEALHAALSEPLPREHLTAWEVFFVGPEHTHVTAAAEVAAAGAEAAQRIEAFNAEASKYADAVKAEEKRRAEEAARRAAEAAAAAKRGLSPPRPGETQHQRITRIYNSLPFSFNWVISEQCTIPQALACYHYHTQIVTIKQRLFGRADCRIRNALAHEYRHYWQHMNGKFTFVDGVLTNVDWLEADARAFGNKYGC